MITAQRIAVLAVAVVILVAAFVLTRGSCDEEPAATQAAPTTTEPASTGAAQTTATTAPAEPAPRVETIRIRGGEPVGEPRTLTYAAGDTVRLRFVSDTEGEVHVHGYDKEVEVPAGGTASLRFEADAEGVFEIESHATDTLLAKLEIRP